MRIVFRDFEKTEYIVIDFNYNILGEFETYQEALDCLQFYTSKMIA